MKIISWNVNGIRSVYRNGFLNWLHKTDADIVCLQEIKAQDGQIPEALSSSKKYHLYINQAMKKGYSGVIVLTKKKPLKIENKLGLERFDNEGRMLKLTYSNFVLIVIYMPHGGREKENLNYKIKVYKKFFRYI
ncbi:endonuclease/exonuclease/phosphatase family protein, partial [Patescibacteria group bacterium]|nr:endonuclease/exonuclease/phosphatase family protein [Patescibacteria group bacterium]